MVNGFADITVYELAIRSKRLGNGVFEQVFAAFHPLAGHHAKVLIITPFLQASRIDELPDPAVDINIRVNTTCLPAVVKVNILPCGIAQFLLVG